MESAKSPASGRRLVYVQGDHVCALSTAPEEQLAAAIEYRLARTRVPSSTARTCETAPVRRQLMSPSLLRVGLVVLLLGGAYFASLPWAKCAFSLPGWVSDLLRICTFGTGNPVFDQLGPGALWPYPLAAAIYVLAAVAVTFTRRVHFDAATR